jgi:P4 family phage/plasmid primase-like protien
VLVAEVVGDLGVSEETCLDLMLEHYNGRCEPPWDADELADKVHNAYRYRRSAVGSATAEADFADEPPGEEAGEDPRVWPTGVAYEHKHGAKNARLFLSRRPARLISSERTLYSFEGGIWRETSDDALAAEVRATDPVDFLDVNHVRNIVTAVHHRTATRARPFEWIKPPSRDVALFANGLLDVETGELLPHDGRYFATALPAHRYESGTACPAWERWLREALDPSYHPTLQEFFGLCLTADVRAHKFLCLIGVKRGGKSTCADVLRGLVGPGHSTSALLQDLGSDFGLQECLDKRLLLIPDAHDVRPGSRVAALERIKSVTGGDHVSVNRKNRSIVTAVLPTRVVVAANKLPKFIDESGALASRMLIVRFDRSFEGKEDRGTGAKLATEMPGIANWALEGLRRLRSNGLRFTVGEEGRVEAREAERSQSPALRFAEARLVVTGDDSDFTAMSEVYAAYQEWTHDEGLSPSERRNQMDLWMDLRAALGNRVRYTQRRVERRQVYGLAGVTNVTRRHCDAQDFDPLA